jgi:16S rRNA (guanine527-N7)-methyltransferase
MTFNELSSPAADVLAFLAQCGVATSAEKLDLLAQLCADLQAANRDTNLTRIVDDADFWTRHVADSLAVLLACPAWRDGAFRIADVGCGGGFPLLPLAWVNPNLEIVGIEPRGKKVAFIEREISRLHLHNASIVNAQAREAGRREGLAGSFDGVVLRAVATTGRMVRECRALLKAEAGVKIVNYKTPAAVEVERNEALREAKKFGFTVRESEIVTLPGDAGERQFVILEK